MKCSQSTHDTIKRNKTSFIAHTGFLPNKSEESFQDTYGGGLLLLRNCVHCESTLAWPLRQEISHSVMMEGDFDDSSPTEKIQVQQ